MRSHPFSQKIDDKASKLDLVTVSPTLSITNSEIYELTVHFMYAYTFAERYKSDGSFVCSYASLVNIHYKSPPPPWTLALPVLVRTDMVLLLLLLLLLQVLPVSDFTVYSYTALYVVRLSCWGSYCNTHALTFIQVSITWSTCTQVPFFPLFIEMIEGTHTRIPS